VKKILMISVIASGLLFADGVVDRENIKIMQDLETATATVLKGFLYNNKAVVGNGVKDIKKLSETIEAFEIHNNTKKGFNAKKYAIDEAASISTLADSLQKQFEEGKKDEATRTYSTIVNKCIACYKIIRKW
jgi:plasmid maintenance system killer protein